MPDILLQNILLLVMLGFVIFGLSVLKRRLLRLSEALSEKARQRHIIVSNPAKDFC